MMNRTILSLAVVGLLALSPGVSLADDQPDATIDYSGGSAALGIGYSWGGYESLALPVDPYRTVSEPPAQDLVRLHIGLEDPKDLIADLSQAFDQAGRSP